MRFFSAQNLKVWKSTLSDPTVFSFIIILKWCSTHYLSIYSPGPFENFLKLITEVSSKVFNSVLLRYPSLSRSNKSNTNLIFSLVPLRHIIDSPQQNSLKSMNPERSLSNNLNADSATLYIKFYLNRLKNYPWKGL